jgi:hypothetical protein
MRAQEDMPVYEVSPGTQNQESAVFELSAEDKLVVFAYMQKYFDRLPFYNGVVEEIIKTSTTREEFYKRIEETFKRPLGKKVVSELQNDISGLLSEKYKGLAASI